MKIKALLIDIDTKQVRKAEYERDSLEQIYGLLKCSTIDIVNRKFNIGKGKSKSFDIICDDEGLLDPAKANKPAVITLDHDGKDGNIAEVIVGNCLIVSHDDDGYAVSLTDEEMDGLLKFSFLKANEREMLYCMLN